jgi:hypothetical protein
VSRNCNYVALVTAHLSEFAALYEAANRHANGSDRWVEVQPGYIGFHFEIAGAHAKFCKDVSRRGLEMISCHEGPENEAAHTEPAKPGQQTSSAASKKDIVSDRSVDSLIRKHPQLYHYTTAAGLKGIIENNALWATYFGDLNDSHEIHELRRPLVAELEQRLTPFLKALRQKGIRATNVSKSGEAHQLAESWANSCYTTVFQPDVKKRTSVCYISSFCSHADDQIYEQEHGLLSQWRGYGKDGGGFCLVFDTAALYELFEQENRSYVYPYADFREVHYVLDDVPQLPVFSELLHRSEEIIKAAVMGNRDFSVDDGVLAFLATATTFKHRGFFEEREVRLIAVAATEAAAEIMKNVRGYKLLPLKHRPTMVPEGRKRNFISLFGRNFPPLPVQRVIVGPSRMQDDNAAMARKIVGKGVFVTKSATPFIG